MMEFPGFDSEKDILYNQYENIQWIDGSGISKEEALPRFREMLSDSTLTVAEAKARALDFVLENCRIAIDADGIFQDKIDARGISAAHNWETTISTVKSEFPEIFEEKLLAESLGAWSANHDYGHTSANMRALLGLGFGGLRARLVSARDSKKELSESQTAFYSACIDTLSSISRFTQRLGDASEKINPQSARCLKSIACDPPKNTYEAMQLIIIYFVVYEFVLCGRLRTLGRLDEMLLPFYEKDLENGTFTKEQIKELFKHFLCRFHAMKVPFDQPLLLGGIDRDGNEVTNELSYMIVEAYNELNIHSPKIHIRVSDKTPESFVKLVLSCIRGGNSSFVFACDNTVIKSLTKLGFTEREARDYVFIGCYEAAIWGVEVPCTGSGSLNLAKCAELAMNCGKDMATGKQIGRPVGKIQSYNDFSAAVKEQISYLSGKTVDYIRAIESLYPVIYADPLLSSLLDNCVESGVDAYAGGAKYNNSSINYAGIATLTDIMAAVKKVVFEEKRISFEDLCALMKSNWQDGEKLRLYCSSLKEKYGNGNEVADSIARDMAKHVAQSLNGVPNGRGGYFKAGLFSIDHCFPLGEKTAATPDGRFAGEPLSKNLCATTAKDRKGITALARSVAGMDLSDFSNGSVLDIIMHPTAVSGEDGLCAMYGVLKTFFDAGGFAMHGNVFDAGKLREAQKDPQKYSTLQVRVCGWNAYFVNLSKKEQDEFIKQTEHIS